MAVPSPSDGLAAWQAVIAALAGGLIAFAGNFAAKLWDLRQQRRAIRAAFGAEIASLLSIAETRGHEEHAKAWIAAWKRGENFIPKMYGEAPREDPVYSKNVDKIGMLGPDAADVVLFYTNLNAIRVHFRVILADQVKDMPIPARLGFFEPALKLWQDTKPLAQKLVAQLLPKQR